MGTITGSNDNDNLNGGTGNDTINSGNGDDTVNGGDGNDSINGGAGNDILDGDSGSDQVNGGSGDDTLIYNVIENSAAGTKDVYTGGSGIDTVVLQLSSAQWTDSKVRAELQRYVEFLASVKTNQQGEVSNGAASDFTFSFGSSTLTVQMMEKLVVAVQETAGGPYNTINYLAALITGNGAGSVVEAGGTNNAMPGKPSVVGDLYADDLNGADDSFQAAAGTSAGQYGTYSVDNHGVWSYSLNNSHADVQSLAVGESLNDSFTVRSADGSSKVVQIHIEGSNDAPVVTGALSAGTAEGYWAYSRDLLQGASDADHGETATLKVSDVSYSVNGGASSFTPPAGVSLADNILTVDPKNTAFDHLAAGKQLTIVVSYNIKDVHGAMVAQTETITVTGTNDAPVVSGSLSGGANEDGAAVSFDALADASDVDDGATLSVVGLPAVLPDGVTYAVGTHSFVLDPSHAAFQGLAVGQTTTVTVAYGVSDGTATVATSATFTITGTNDKVLITSGAQSGAVTENSVSQANGTISFTDVDLADGHTASFAAVQNALGTFALTTVSEDAGAANGQVGWSYTLNDSKADYLAVGETKSETYAVTVNDGHGSTTTENVVITITGTNDNVVISSLPQSGSVVENSVSQADGTIMFSDVDLADGHTASFIPVQSALGTFALTAVSEDAGGANGQVGWNYTLNDTKADYLAAGETKTETYAVTVNDGHGSTKTENVVITITGTNDDVTITSAPQVGSVVENSVSHADGTITFTDADLKDGHTASFAPVDDALGTFALTSVSEVAGAANGQVGWNYTLNDSSANYLAAGETKTETYAVTVNDGHGSTKTENVVITITGTNDDVMITSDPQVGSVVENSVAFADGTITFTDADLKDGHTASFAPVDDALGTFSLLPVSEVAGAANGEVSWSYTLTDASANYLAAGETKTETYAVTVDDGHGSTKTENVVITITGTNDDVMITSVPQVGSVVEDSVAYADGTITFTDADLKDGHTASFAPVDDALGTFALIPVSEVAGAANGEVSWSYSLSDTSANYLAAGETKTETYAVTVNDGHGSTKTENVVITITGTNDDVMITSVPQVGSVVENSVAHADGTITFTDADLKDGHTASFAPVDDALGTFALTPVSEVAGAANGEVSWSYSLSDTSANYLAAGETKTETYAVTVDDGQGSTKTENVVITVTGTNDDVMITSVPQVGSVVENSVAFADGTITFTDADLKDGHTASFAPVDDALGTFSVLPVSEVAGAANGEVSWSYSLSDTSANYLAAGETKTETYAVTVNDGHGSTKTENVVITITGTNDDVMITSVPQVGSVVENSVAFADGTITFTDADLKDGHSASFAPVDDALGTFALTPVSEVAGAANGEVSWSYSLSDTSANYLAAGETKTETYAVTVDDGHGSTKTENVVITITGTNDDVMITSVPQVGSVVENSVAFADGTITFTDADLKDGHTASFAPVDDALGTFALTPVSEVAGAANGEVSWSYSLSDTSANYLAAGETKTETYAVTVDDGHGSTKTENVVITITGTNDDVMITSVPQVGSVVENSVAFADGTITFTDADLKDGHTASFAPVDDALGTFSLLPVSEVAGAANGEVSWSYSLSDTSANYLAAGETKTETYAVTVDDGHGSTKTENVVITITGTNDDVMITSVPQVGSVVENSVAHADGTITFTDADLKDGHTASFAPVDDALGTFSLLPVSEVAGAANGQVGWNYTLNDTKADYLAAGETKTETYAVTVNDGHGSTKTENVVITVTGTNDDVMITSLPQVGSVVENSVAHADGTITFTDADLKDGHTASFAPVDDALGTFALTPVSEVAGAANGEVSWSYSLSDTSANYLAAGETKTETYAVTVNDGHGSTKTENVVITITGTNDDVMITSVPQVGSVVENSVAFADGTITFTDADLKDGHTASFAPVDDALGTFALTPVSEVAGAANGEVSWSYSLSDARANYLAAGETKTETYAVTVNDGHGSTKTENVVITITGTNDNVVISSLPQSGAVVENSVSQTNGAITFSDVDLADGHTASFAPVQNALGTFALAPVSEDAGAANGQVGWSYTLNDSRADYLAAGETKTEIYAVTVNDGHGSTATQNVQITITGSNDNVIISSGPQSGSVTEDVATPASGSIRFSDADASDLHNATFTGPFGALGTFALGALSESGGQVGWTYAVDSTKANYLAAGQSVTETYTVKVDDQHGSAPTQDVVITIFGSNDAPVLNAAATPNLASVNEDAGAPVGAVGSLVSSLVDLNPPAAGLNNVTDADSNAQTGLALTGTNSANGTWWYTTNDGALWKQVGAVANTSALLLTADSHTRIYFQGSADFNGLVSNALTFRAWDGTSGTAGSLTNTSANGGSSAFSTAFDTADITVAAVNDNPVAAPDRIVVSDSTDVSFQASALLANDTDIDGSALQVFSVGAPVGISNLSYNATTGVLSFTSDASAGNSTGSFQYTVWDSLNGFSTAKVTIEIWDVANGNTMDTINLTNSDPYVLSYLDGRGGGDDFTGAAGGDVFFGGTGSASDTLRGSVGNDLLVGGDGNDTLSGGAGNDVLRGGIGNNDTMDGGAGTEDMLDFSDGTMGITFTLQQGTGAGGSAISITNGTGNLGNNDGYLNMEGVIGTSLVDNITGSSGNDILRGGGGDDVLDGKGGIDLLDFSDGAAGIVFTLVNNGSNTSFNASGAGLGTDKYSGFEGVIGTNFADTLNGSTLADQLRGGGGNDTINGLAGADRIVGGGGADIMSGGADNDTFVFDTAPNAVDSIMDFNASGLAGSGDTLELSAAIFAGITTASGNVLSAAEFASLDGAGASGNVAGTVRVIYDSSTGNLYYDSDGLGSANRSLMAHLAFENPSDTFDQNDIKVGL